MKTETNMATHCAQCGNLVPIVIEDENFLAECEKCLAKKESSE